MTLSDLEDIPTELLHRICYYLERRDLSNFSLASRQCHSAACKYVFESIQIRTLKNFVYTQTLRTAIEILNRTASFYHVHTLRLEEVTAWAQDRGKEVPPYDLQTDPFIGVKVEDLAIWSEADERRLGDYSDWNESIDDRAWTSVAAFIEMLPGLRRIIWNCRCHIPEAILNVLRQTLPHCKIDASMLALDGQQSRQQRMSVLDTTPIMPWPLLSSLSTRLSDQGEGIQRHKQVLSYFDKALHDAPYLETLRIWWVIPDYVAADEVIPISNSLVESDDSQKLTSVTTLQLRIERYVDTVFLEHWAHRLDFNKLKTLTLEGTMTASVMSWLSTSCCFSFLRSLVLNSWWFWDSFRLNSDVDEYANQLSVFIRSLRPLAKLRILGFITDTIFAAILGQHGNYLRQLWLENQTPKSSDLNEYQLYNFHLGLEHIDEMCRSCIKLKDLKIPIRRTRGDAREVAVYKKLGSLRALRNLFLIVDITSPYIQEPVWEDRPVPEFNALENRLYYADALYLRKQLPEIIINFAVDSYLIESVFHTISTAREPNMQPLELLHFEPTGTSSISEVLPIVGLPEIVSRMARSWIVKRDERDTHRDQVTVYELKPKDVLGLWPPYPIDQDLDGILDRLWPRQREDGISSGSSWFESWHSFPLAAAE